MKETKEMSYFDTTMKELAERQKAKRDEFLDAVMNDKFDEAKSRLEELQTVSVGIQVCQQTILRDADMKAAEIQRKNQEEMANKQEQSAAVLELKPKKGWFR